MRSVAFWLVFVFAICGLSAGCSVSNPIAGASVEGSAHGGWGAPRAAADVVAPAQPEGRQEDQSPDAGPEQVASAVEVPEEARQDEAIAAGGESGPTRRVERQATEALPETVTQAPPAPQPEATAGATIRRISVTERSDGRGLVVRLHSTGHIPAFRAEAKGDGEIEVTLFQTDVAATVPASHGPIQQIRVAHEGGRAIVRLRVDPSVFVVPQAYPDRDSNDLLLALTYAPRPVASTPPPARPASTTASASGSGGDEASREHWRLDCIVLDAGHGGRDPGAVSHGVRESDVTLGITLRLGKLIEDNLGVRVVYTRRDDRFVELAERGRIANQSCGKLFVSIHGNSASNRSATGTETYFLGVHRSESARQVMERENSVIALESDPDLYSGMDEAALIMQTMAQTTYLRISEQLASLIENQFVSNAGRRSRGVKQAGFLVLWRASMPAVLVETGFISNRDEARFLASAQGQQAIADSIFRAIREYKQQYEKGLGIAVN
jgi:N-acetylmuramoyl-L-alanine amidase